MTQAAEQPHSSRARDASATRAALLHAAMRQFTVLGYEHTTTRDIAAEAGVNVSLINRYFGSKDGLFAAVMRESASTLDTLAATQPADRLVDTMLSKLDPDLWPEFGCEHPLLLLLRDVGEDDRVGDLRRRSLAAVITQLATQVQAETPAVPGSAGLRAELILAMVAGVLTLRATLPGGALASADAGQLRAELERITECIIAPPAASDEPLR